MAPRKKSKRRPDSERLLQVRSLELPESDEEATEEEEDAEWAFLRDCGRVRHKFLTYTPADIRTIDDKSFLD